MEQATTRRTLLAGAAALALGLAIRGGPAARAEPLPEVTVYKGPT
jgi:hypothetical protein